MHQTDHMLQTDGGTNTRVELDWIQFRFSPTWTSDDSVTARRSRLQNKARAELI